MNQNTNGAAPRTAESKLRGNRVHLRLNRLCAEWMKKNRPEIVERLRKQAKKGEAGR